MEQDQRSKNYVNKLEIKEVWKQIKNLVLLENENKS